MHVHYTPLHLSCIKVILFSFCGSILFLANNAHSITCYVCGPEGSQIDCNSFNLVNENLYTKECPATSKGCSAYYRGNAIISMACEEDKFDVCQTANNIEYCYCTFSFCNGNISLKKPITYNRNIDDEDINEGSGFNKIFPATVHTFSSKQTTARPMSTANSIRGTLFLIVTTILLH